jgi:hypothetical protein
MAQVFSQNAVGYYNMSLGSGFTMIANQLNNGANTVNDVLPAGLPDGSTLISWNNAGQLFNDADTFFAGYGWFDSGANPSTTPLAPGGGAFINLPPGQTAAVTVVGEVPQGQLPLDLVPGFQIISQLTPQEIGLEATGFPAADGDTLIFWDTSTQAYSDALTYFAGYGWFTSATELVDPTPLLGESVFYNRVPSNGSDTWTRTFNVNP